MTDRIKMSLEELMLILNHEHDTPIRILPNGEIVSIGTIEPEGIENFKKIILSDAFGETGDY